MDWIATGIFAAGHVICHRLNFEDVDRAEFGDLRETECGVVNQPGGGCVWHQRGGHV